ncbi:MAG: hypothetical protein ACRDUA_06110 [Micromonosporaceae bacterium]
MRPDPAASDDPVVEQLRTDPDAMSRRLAEDLAAVRQLGRGGATADPDLEPEELVSAVRAQAGALTFESPVAAATAALRHGAELPYQERGGDRPFRPYHASASLTVSDGEVVREWLGSDGGIELVFRREAREVNDTGVLLEATVRVAGSGPVSLTSYGWPTRAVDLPVYHFGGAAEGYLRQLADDLATAGQTPALFERAMLMGYGFAVAQALRGPVPDEIAQAAQQQVVRLVVERLPMLGHYLEQAVDLADLGGQGGWLAGCVRRSAAESLFANFLGGVTFDLVEVDLLGELQQAIAEAAEGVPAPHRSALVPAGTPAGHTWWLADAV